MVAFVILSLNLGEVANDLQKPKRKPSFPVAVNHIAAIVPRHAVDGTPKPGSEILLSGGSTMNIWETPSEVLDMCQRAVDDDRRAAASYTLRR